MTEASFAISLLVLYVVWKKVWQVTVLEIARDELFHVRDTVREYFLTTEQGVSDPVYSALREHINNCLRHTENITVARVLLCKLMRKRHGEYMQAVFEQHLQTFMTDDKEISNFVEDKRLACASILMTYMLAKSFLGMLVITAIIIIAIPCALVHFFATRIKGHLVVPSELLGAAIRFIFAKLLTRPIVARNLETVENYTATPANA
ncbi:MAG: hypothetical protein R3Y11_07040 [Pseudomonadota bacterium]